jgi:uncharacterized protein (DUF169 family)
MLTIEEYNALGRELEDNLLLRFHRCLKLINADEIPEGCIRPRRDRGVHYALCQAFAAVRREKKAIALFKEDHWCVWPVVSLKLTPKEEGDDEYLGSKEFLRDPQKGIRHFKEHFPYIAEDRRKDGLALAPLSKCNFEPDIICVYCIPSQLRQLLMAAKYNTAELIPSALETYNSCGTAIIPVLNGERPFNVTIPDAGEYDRSLADESEMVFTMSAGRLKEIVESLKILSSMGFGYKQLAFDMNLDYPRAEFYNVMFEKWGLDIGRQWKPGDRS